MLRSNYGPALPLPRLAMDARPARDDPPAALRARADAQRERFPTLPPSAGRSRGADGGEEIDPDDISDNPAFDEDDTARLREILAAGDFTPGQAREIEAAVKALVGACRGTRAAGMDEPPPFPRPPRPGGQMDA